jgi:hypothetical protein
MPMTAGNLLPVRARKPDAIVLTLSRRSEVKISLCDFVEQHDPQ